VAAYYLDTSALASALGPIISVEQPPQGSAFHVYILSTGRGRFVVKRGTTQATVRELVDESRLLQALQDERPFVATPVGFIADGDTDTFAFTYIDGETVLAALQNTDEAGQHALVASFGRALRRVHTWTPPLPRPDDWLAMMIEREHMRLLVRQAGHIITGTHTRFDGLDARRLIVELRDWMPTVSNDIVFGHGDYCLPNVLVVRQASS